MEGEDAPGGFLFFKAIDARGSQTDSRTTSKTNSNGATKGGVGGEVLRKSSDERSDLFLKQRLKGHSFTPTVHLCSLMTTKTRFR